MNSYEIKIDDGIFKVKLHRHNTPIRMYYALRSKAVDSKPGIYILTDDRNYCCYVGQTGDLKSRLNDHGRDDKFFWWSHTIYFCDDPISNTFSSTDERLWYEKLLKCAVESKHPTFTQKSSRRPREPEYGNEVFDEILALLDVIRFESKSPVTPSQEPQPRQAQRRPQHPHHQSSEPMPHKNHRPKLGSWPNHTALAKAIAVKNGKPGTAGGILQKLTNFWAPSRGCYAKANVETRQMLESFGVVFDSDGFVKSCENVPFPLS